MMHAGASVERRAGDWDCSCGELNFASRVQCRKCHADRRGGGAPGVGAVPVRAMSTGVPAQVPGPLGGQEHSQQPVRPGDWYCPSCDDLNFASRTQCRKCSTQKPRTGLNFQYGDWYCPMCEELNFGRRTMCRRCNAPRDAPRAKPGDWFCANCGDLNFASREECRKCSAPASTHSVARAERVLAKGKPGDWTCPSCNELNFASRTECRHCQTELKPDTARVGLKSGDWFCTQCHDLNFASRDVCRKCSASKPLLG